MRISDWSSDVCSSDLAVSTPEPLGHVRPGGVIGLLPPERTHMAQAPREVLAAPEQMGHVGDVLAADARLLPAEQPGGHPRERRENRQCQYKWWRDPDPEGKRPDGRSERHPQREQRA